MRFYPDGEIPVEQTTQAIFGVAAETVQKAVEVVQQVGGVGKFPESFNVTDWSDDWSETFIYASVGIAGFKVISDFLEVLYERACYEIAVQEEFSKGLWNILSYLNPSLVSESLKIFS